MGGGGGRNSIVRHEGYMVASTRAPNVYSPYIILVVKKCRQNIYSSM